MLRLRNSRLKRIHVLPSKGSLPRTMRTLSLDRELQTLNDDHCPPQKLPEKFRLVSEISRFRLKHNYDDNIRSSYQNRLHRSAGRHRRGSPRTRINLISVRATLTHTPLAFYGWARCECGFYDMLLAYHIIRSAYSVEKRVRTTQLITVMQHFLISRSTCYNNNNSTHLSARIACACSRLPSVTVVLVSESFRTRVLPPFLASNVFRRPIATCDVTVPRTCFVIFSLVSTAESDPKQ